MVGANALLENTGDYFLFEQLDSSVIVVKGKDGIIRAFLNVCRHRGVKLLEEKEGHIKRNIVCPYHAWAFDTTGCLKGIFHPQGFQDISADTHSLIELDCEIRFGMIFVILNPDLRGKFDFDAYFKEATEMLSQYDLSDHVPFYPVKGTKDCNWKLLVDGGLESYHVQIAHSKTISPIFLDNVSVFGENKFHNTIIFPKKSIKTLQHEAESNWELREHANLLVHLFPNTTILMLPDHAMIMSSFPKDEKTSAISAFMLVPEKPETEKAKNYWRRNADMFWNAIEEDNDMAILQQKSFNSYPDTYMTIGSYEKLILQFENLVDEALDVDYYKKFVKA
jgi:phenylpropionate dioxygenase-like ring-hydroxylating dioxygenase large terminal subunit